METELVNKINKSRPNSSYSHKNVIHRLYNNNNNKSNLNNTNLNTKLVKTLQSNIHIKEKEFTSIFPCQSKQNKRKKSLDKNSIFLFPFGPLIITHKEKREKLKIDSKLKKYTEEKVHCTDHFRLHRNCNETKFYWNDLNHPKILRHYSKDKNNNK